MRSSPNVSTTGVDAFSVNVPSDAVTAAGWGTMSIVCSAGILFPQDVFMSMDTEISPSEKMCMILFIGQWLGL